MSFKIFLKNLSSLSADLIGSDLKAEEVARKAIEVAAGICVFTNNNVRIEKI